ncbi:MAG: SGNH/GDSL hydrolase family protein [Myxococcota bacterium]
MDDEDAGAAPSDAGADSPDGGPDPGPTRAELYSADTTQSPLTPHVAANLRQIAALVPDARGDVFAKIGDDSTASSNFLRCFGSGVIAPGPSQDPGSIDLDGRDHLQPTIARLRDGDADGSDPFQRASLAAAPGWTAQDLLSGDPAPLDREYAALSPRFAMIMLGTNDVDDRAFYDFGNDLRSLVEHTTAAGIIPILSSVMPRDDSPAADAEVVRFNAITRGVAQAAQIPFIDLHRELAALPDHGLGEDLIRPSVYRNASDQPVPCAFANDALQYGYNLRNLLSIEALDRVVRVVEDDAPAPDSSQRTLAGAGLSYDPFVIGELPFAHAADTGQSSSRMIDRYDGCGANQNESGPEYIYRFDVDRAMTVRAMVIDRDGADIDVHLMRDGIAGEFCVQRNHRAITGELEPGTYYFNLDTFVTSGGTELVGEYMFVLVEEPGS